MRHGHGCCKVQFLDTRHRTQAHVEDRMKQFKACGARNLPSIDYGRNAAWLQLAALAALATSLTAWLRHIGLDGEATAATKTLRFRILSAPARLVAHARRRILKISPGWAWSPDLVAAWDRLQARTPADQPARHPSDPPPQHPAGWNRRPPEHPRATSHDRRPKRTQLMIHNSYGHDAPDQRE